MLILYKRSHVEYHGRFTARFFKKNTTWKSRAEDRLNARVIQTLRVEQRGTACVGSATSNFSYEGCTGFHEHLKMFAIPYLRGLMQLANLLDL